MAGPDDPDIPPAAPVVRFPQSRVPPPGSGEAVKELGTSGLAERLGAPVEQTTGHWCSRCRGI